jgi:hypothetical protein
MKQTFATLILLGSLSAAGPIARAADAAPPATEPQVRVTWIGQDGHDVVGPSSVLAPSDTQDLHLKLENLPKDKTIKHLVVLRQGGSEWQYEGHWGPWKAQVVREPGSTSADLYLEPTNDETGAVYNIQIDYSDGSTVHTGVKTGRSDTKLRMPDAILKGQWKGQDGRDWTRPAQAVGPDGIQDVVIHITGLSDKSELKSVRLQAGGDKGLLWEYGILRTPHWNAELLRDPKSPRVADLLIGAPPQSLEGQSLTLTVSYANDRSDTATIVAGAADPKLATPAPSRQDIAPIKLSAQWLGQDGAAVTGRGDVHVRLSGLPQKATYTAATLSDTDGGYWIWKQDPKTDVYTPTPGEDIEPMLPLAVKFADGGTADLYFPPYRDEHNTRMTLRLITPDGASRYAQFDGGDCDPFLRGPAPANTATVAKPGDDLQALAGQFGKITLSPGLYKLTAPLHLDKPITVTGAKDAGGAVAATLEFTQPQSDKPWHGAVIVGADNVTLDGFAIRFSAPVRWSTDDWKWGAAIIRTTELENRTGDLVNLIVRGLDIETSPIHPVADKSKPELVPNLIRVGRILSGQIIGNKLRGGTIDLVHGPWTLADNQHLGTLPDTFTWDTFAGHYLHDLKVLRNQVQPLAGHGKIWRFLTLTQYSSHAIVSDNNVRGVGMRDNDVVPNPNAPEIFLTEGYRLHYEGTPAHVSADGRIVQIPMVMWGAIRPGTVLAILTGPHAGQWLKVAQPVDDKTFLLDKPLPADAHDAVISLSSGFVEDTYENNTIDSRGGASVNMFLAANTFGTRVLNNHFLGAGGLICMAPPTNAPSIWGWSHCPFFGVQFNNNILEDVRQGILFTVEHSPIHIQYSPGRLYMNATAENNIIRYTQAFADWHAAHLDPDPAKRPIASIHVGTDKSPGPADLHLTSKDNRVQAPPALREAAVMEVNAGTVNGQPLQNQKLPLPLEDSAAAR